MIIIIITMLIEKVMMFVVVRGFSADDYDENERKQFQFQNPIRHRTVTVT